MVLGLSYETQNGFSFIWLTCGIQHNEALLTLMNHGTTDDTEVISLLTPFERLVVQIASDHDKEFRHKAGKLLGPGGEGQFG